MNKWKNTPPPWVTSKEQRGKGVVKYTPRPLAALEHLMCHK